MAHGDQRRVVPSRLAMEDIAVLDSKPQVRTSYLAKRMQLDMASVSQQYLQKRKAAKALRRTASSLASLPSASPASPHGSVAAKGPR